MVAKLLFIVFFTRKLALEENLLRQAVLGRLAVQEA